MSLETISLQNTISRVQTELAQAEKDVAFYEQLKEAHSRRKKLHAHLEELQQQLAEASKPKASNIKDVRISVESREGNILRETYHVSITRAVHNYRTHGTDDVTTMQVGLLGLPVDVVSWLADHTDRIPAGVIALAPDNAREALRKFAAALRRGYLN